MASKVLSYLGFLQKSGKLKAGYGAIELLRDRPYALILCSTASENAKKKAFSLARKFGNIPVILSKETRLDDLTGKENCKIAASLDKGLTEVILNNLDGCFTLISEGDD